MTDGWEKLRDYEEGEIILHERAGAVRLSVARVLAHDDRQVELPKSPLDIVSSLIPAEPIIQETVVPTAVTTPILENDDAISALREDVMKAYSQN